MYRYKKYSEEQMFLKIAILVMGGIAFLLGFARALKLGIEYMIQEGQNPLFAPITDYFTGFNLAFNVPTGKVGYQHYVPMATVSYLTPLVFSVLPMIKIKKVPRYIPYFIAAVVLIIIPIFYVIKLQEAIGDLERIIEIDSLLIGKKYRNLQIEVQTEAIMHAALTVITGFLSIAAGVLALLTRERRVRK